MLKERVQFAAWVFCVELRGQSRRATKGTLIVDCVCASGASESAITDMQAYMDMLNPDLGSEATRSSEAESRPPPPPAYPPPPPPPPQCPPIPPPPPGYPAPKPPPREPSSAEFLKVKSNLRHVDSNTTKKKVRAEDRLLSDH